jgi:hypothetical protein
MKLMVLDDAAARYTATGLQVQTSVNPEGEAGDENVCSYLMAE